MAKMQQKLFRLERFIASDHEFRFYTGFPDYATFKVFLIICHRHVIILFNMIIRMALKQS